MFSCFVRETFYGGETHSHEGTHFCVFLRWPVFRGVDLKPLQAPFQFTTAGPSLCSPNYTFTASSHTIGQKKYESYKSEMPCPPWQANARSYNNTVSKCGYFAIDYGSL